MADRPTGGPSGPPESLESRIHALGRHLFARIGSGPRPWHHRGWWDDRLMAMTMGDESTKVQLFRFIDALPTLSNPRSTRRHLGEYLDEAGTGVPALIKGPLAITPSGPLGDRLLSGIAQFAATTMARRFIAGSTPDEAFATVMKLRSKRLAFTADLLGESVISESEADAYQQTCLNLLRGLSGRLNASPEVSPDRPRPRRPDPSRQSFPETDQPDDRIRRPPRRDHHRTRPDSPPSNPADGPRGRRVRQRRHGAIRP